MNLEGVSVSAYGQLVDWSVELSPGLNLLFAENEGGKTTLASFIETMFYGFEPKTSNPYEPWHAHDVDFGGELIYELADGRRFTLRRFLAPRRRRESLTLLDPEGAEVPVTADSVGGMHLRHGRRVFRAIYSVDLDDLKMFDTKDYRRLGEVFFSDLQTKGEAKNPRVALNELVEERSRLFRASGPGRNTSTLAKFKREALAPARERLKQATEADEKARTLAAEIRIKEEQLADHKRGAQDVQKRLLRLNKLTPLSSLAAEINEREAQLSSLRGYETFPVEQEQKMVLYEQEAERLKLEEAQRLQELENIRTLIDKRTGKIAGVKSILAAREKIRSLATQANLLRQRDTEASERIRQILEEAAALRQKGDKCFTTDALTALESKPLPREDQEALLASIEPLVREADLLEDIETRIKNLHSRIDEISEARQQVEDRLSDEFPDEFNPTRLAELQEVHRNMAEWSEKMLRMAELDERAQQETEETKRLEAEVVVRGEREASAREAGAKANRRSARYLFISADVLLALTVVGLLAALIGRSWPVCIIALVLGIVAAYGLFLASRFRTKGTELEGGDSEAEDPLLPRQRARLAEISTQSGFAKKQVAQWKERTHSSWQQVELDGDPDLDRLRRELESEKQLNAQFPKWRELQGLKQEILRETKRLETLQNERDEKRRSLDEGLGQVRAKLTELGLTCESGKDLRRLTREIEDAFRIHDSLVLLASRRMEAERLAEPVRRFDGECESLFQELGRTEHAEEPHSLLPTLARELEEAEQQEVELQELRRRFADAETLLSGIRHTRELNEENTRSLLEATSSTDLTDFRERAQKGREYQALARDVAEQKRRLERIEREFGLTTAALPQDRTASFLDLQQESEDLALEFENLKERVEALSKQLGSQKEELSRLESEGNVPLAQGALDEAEGEYEALVMQHDALVVSEIILKDAMERYQRERQPGILQRSRDYFQQMTRGKYDRVLMDLFGESKSLDLRVISGSSDERKIDVLSRATQEQIYLALRLALADQLAEGETIPVIIDDALVNFDAGRFAETATLVQRRAAKGQVLFFTCHEPVRDHLASLGGRVIAMASPAEADTAGTAVSVDEAADQ